MFRIPNDPFLHDALGASRFCLELLRRNWKGIDYLPAIRWSARCSAHWAVRSEAWSTAFFADVRQNLAHAVEAGLTTEISDEDWLRRLRQLERARRNE
jgi:hypothetical protein